MRPQIATPHLDGGAEGDRALPFLDRLRLPAQVRQGHTPVGKALGVLAHLFAEHASLIYAWPL
jgi:hypothetical protein